MDIFSAVELFDGFMGDLIHVLVSVAIHLFELVGVIVLIAAGVRGVVNYVRRDPMVRLNLAKGMALCLEFKLGSEILRTVVVREFTELLLVGAIILLRAALTMLIHWEIRNEKADEAAAADLIESAAASEQPTPAVPTVTTVVTADTGNHVQADTEPTSATTASSEDSAKK